MMLSAEPVSTRKYLFELLSKTWRRVSREEPVWFDWIWWFGEPMWFDSPTEGTFTSGRAASFPDMLLIQPCRVVHNFGPSRRSGRDICRDLVGSDNRLYTR